MSAMSFYFLIVALVYFLNVYFMSQIVFSCKLRHVLLDSCRNEIDAFHVFARLIGHFSENLLCQVTFLHRFVEDYELNQITSNWSSSIVSEKTAITVELFHCAEISVTNTNNDNGARHMRKIDHDLFSFRHIMNTSVCEEKQDLVDACTLLHERLNICLELFK